MTAKLFYTLWGISLASSLLFPSLSAQRITSNYSSSVPFLYSFVIYNDYVYLGGDQVVEIASISDLVSVQSVNVSRFDRYLFCEFLPRLYCGFNIIDHIFPFADNLLACGSNGGVGGCSLFDGSPDTSFTLINNFTVPLSGNVEQDTGTRVVYLQNSIFLNTENDVIYTQYYSFDYSSYTLGLRNFADFSSASVPTVSSDIPEIISTYDSSRMSQTTTFFFNDPTVGRIFRYASTDTVDYDYINIPFTEIVQESAVSGLDYQYLTPSFHGRLARICANDLGQFATNPSSPFNSFIGTFNKITIDCRQALGLRYSIDSRYVSIALKEIFILDPDNIYGFFTSQNTAEKLIQSSAVCKFISDRDNTGQDFNLETGFSSVYYDGYDPVAVSENTSWTCAYPSTRVSGNLFAATIVNILHMTVVFNEASLAFNKHFEGIIIDVTSVTTSSGSRNITLFYATTFDGYLIKMKVDSIISVVAEFEVTTNTRIFNPQIQRINDVKYLFAISNDQLLKISLQLCDFYTTAITCYRDPECVWDNFTISCIQYDLTSVRDVPIDSELTVDDTCQLSLLPYTLQSLNFSLHCQVKLPDFEPNIIITTIPGASVSTANSEYTKLSNTYATIVITNLESLTGYRTTVTLNYVFAIVPDLVLVAYTQFEQVVVSTPSLTPICPSATTFSSISVSAPVEPFAAITVCAVCNSNQFCIVAETYNPTVPYVFPWTDCILSTSLHNAEGLVVNSSTCTSVDFNRCTSANYGTFQHLNINFIISSTSVTVVLEDGVSPQEFGIEKYTIIYDGMDYTFNSNTVELNSLKPDTSLTIMYTATTQCGLTFNASENVTTNADWSQVDNCQLTNTVSQLAFQFTIQNTELCKGNLIDCMYMESTCSLNFISESSGTLMFNGTIVGGERCTVIVFPSGEPTFTSYYGCSASLSIPIIFTISNIIIEKTTTNSVAVSYSILPAGMHYERTVSVLDSSDNIIQEYTGYLPTGSDLKAGFDSLVNNTDYKIRIAILNDMRTKSFTTDRSPTDRSNVSCFPISSYDLERNDGMYRIIFTRNNQCLLGQSGNFICYGPVLSSNLARKICSYSDCSLNISELTDNLAYGLFTDIASCPPFNNADYQILYSNSIITIVGPPVTATTATPTVPVTPTPQPLSIIFTSVILFYVAICTSSFTVLTSAGGLILLFGLIVCYPKLLKKQESKAGLKQDMDAHELSGMNNPISDSS